MCWSLEVSIAAASCEAVFVVFIAVRSLRSTKKEIQEQILCLPCLLSVLAMEVIEAIIWSRPTELILIQDADGDSSTCPVWNRFLTRIMWILILPWQPFTVVRACRNSGNQNNRDLLKVPEFLSFIFGATTVFIFILTMYLEDPILLNLSDSRYMGYLNRDTCTYVGLHGHLQWTVALANTALTPNIFGYALLWSSCIFARPLRLFGMASFMCLLVFGAQSIYFEGTFEAGSMWCLLAFLLFVYIAVQPYAFPCIDPGERGREREKIPFNGLTTGLLNPNEDRCLVR